MSRLHLLRCARSVFSGNAATSSNYIYYCFVHLLLLLPSASRAAPAVSAAAAAAAATKRTARIFESTSSSSYSSSSNNSYSGSNSSNSSNSSSLNNSDSSNSNTSSHCTSNSNSSDNGNSSRNCTSNSSDSKSHSALRNGFGSALPFLAAAVATSSPSVYAVVSPPAFPRSAAATPVVGSTAVAEAPLAAIAELETPAARVFRHCLFSVATPLPSLSAPHVRRSSSSRYSWSSEAVLHPNNAPVTCASTCFSLSLQTVGASGAAGENAAVTRGTPSTPLLLVKPSAFRRRCSGFLSLHERTTAEQTPRAVLPNTGSSLSSSNVNTSRLSSSSRFNSRSIHSSSYSSSNSFSSNGWNSSCSSSSGGGVEASGSGAIECTCRRRRGNAASGYQILTACLKNHSSSSSDRETAAAGRRNNGARALSRTCRASQYRPHRRIRKRSSSTTRSSSSSTRSSNRQASAGGKANRTSSNICQVFCLKQSCHSCSSNSSSSSSRSISSRRPRRIPFLQTPSCLRTQGSCCSVRTAEKGRNQQKQQVRRLWLQGKRLLLFLRLLLAAPPHSGAQGSLLLLQQQQQRLKRVEQQQQRQLKEKVLQQQVRQGNRRYSSSDPRQQHVGSLSSTCWISLTSSSSFPAAGASLFLSSALPQPCCCSNLSPAQVSPPASPQSSPHCYCCCSGATALSPSSSFSTAAPSSFLCASLHCVLPLDYQRRTSTYSAAAKVNTMAPQGVALSSNGSSTNPTTAAAEAPGLETTQSLNGPHVVFVLGGPGAGKGTQCERLTRHMNLVHISAGDCLREERQRPNSEHGELIERYIREGNIVPVEITLTLLLKKMLANGWSRGFLIDGFPRNEDNLSGWKKFTDRRNLIAKLQQIRNSNPTLGCQCDLALQQLRQQEKQQQEREQGDKETKGEKKEEEDINANSGVPVCFCLYLDCPEGQLEQRLLLRGEKSQRTDDNATAIRKRMVTFKTETLPIVHYFEKQHKVRRVDASASIDDVWQTVAALFKHLPQ